MLVSVIIPVYNSEKYIFSCVKSVLAQSHAELEIILVDDGSTDGSYKVLNDLAYSDSRVKIVRHEVNGGASKARNTGLDNITGKWVMFVDSDDRLHPKCLEDMLKAANEDTSDVVICGMRNQHKKFSYREKSFKGHKKVFRNKDVNYIKKVLLELNTENGCGGLDVTGPVCKLIRAELLNDIRFPEEVSICEDVCFNLQYFDKCESVTYLSKYYYTRIIRNDSLSHRLDNDYPHRRFSYVKWMINYLRKTRTSTRLIDKFMYMNLKEVILYYAMTSWTKLFKRMNENVNAYRSLVGYEINFDNVKDNKVYVELLKKGRYKIYIVLYGIKRVVSLLVNQIKV